MNSKLNFILNFNLCVFLSLIVISLLPQKIMDDSFLLPFLTIGITTTICLIINRSLFWSGLIAGIMATYITHNIYITYAISSIIIIICILNINIFIKKVRILLQPETYMMHQQVGYFIRFFLNLIISFTVLNFSINEAHNQIKTIKAFNFRDGLDGIIDSLYFSIITMTTVGYGDIFPHTSLAKVVISAECIISYVMLGLMIGIITRGIKFSS